jgi:hypothetical protein
VWKGNISRWVNINGERKGPNRIDKKKSKLKGKLYKKRRQTKIKQDG